MFSLLMWVLTQFTWLVNLPDAAVIKEAVTHTYRICHMVIIHHNDLLTIRSSQIRQLDSYQIINKLLNDLCLTVGSFHYSPVSELEVHHSSFLTQKVLYMMRHPHLLHGDFPLVSPRLSSVFFCSASTLALTVRSCL